MQTLRHPTIIKIQKISGYLLKSITFLRFFVAIVGFLFLIEMLFQPLGDVSLRDVLLRKKQCDEPTLIGFLGKHLTLQLKIFGLVVSTLLGMAVILFLNYVHGLISCFHQGDIFNQSALSYAKKAFMMNFYIIASYIFFEAVGVVYSLYHTEGGNAARIMTLLIEIFDNAAWLAFLILGLWALEIGGALKEESELTI